MADGGSVQCPQCRYWNGSGAPSDKAQPGCGLCDGTGTAKPFRAMNGYDWESGREGMTNVEMCIAAIEEYGNCSVGQMAHMAPLRHARNPFTDGEVERALNDPAVAGIVHGG